MTTPLDRITTSVLVLATATIAMIAVRREFFPKAPTSGSNGYVATWADIFRDGSVDGNAGAPVKIVAFMDMQCPFCKDFHIAVHELMTESAGSISVSYLHFPSAGHTQSRPAARAIECARSDGKSTELVNALLAKQDSIGVKSWGSYAHEAGIADSTALVNCVVGTTKFPVIDENLALAHKLGVQGTPTILINGWRFNGTVPKQDLLHLITEIRRGAPPYDKHS